MKPIINQAHEKFLEERTRAANRRGQIRTAPPALPATFEAEREKQNQRQRQNKESIQERISDGRNEAREDDTWDLLKQMEGIKFVRGRPQVQDTPVPRTRVEFNYPSILQQPQRSHLR